MTTPAPADRTYGNWRKPASPGIGGLGLLGTIILMTGLAATVIAMMIYLLAGVVVAVCVAAMLAPLLIRDRHGRNGLQAMTARLAWWRGRRLGQHLYRSGPLGITVRGTCRLPGLAAQSQLVDAKDSYGRIFGMLITPSTGHYTAVFDCAADGAALVDDDQIDTWVAYWGQWLAALSYEPGLVAASVTVETSPDLGTRLEREVHGQTVGWSPPLARSVLQEVVATYPAGSARVATRVAVTYSAMRPGGGKRRSTHEMAREIGTRLPGLSSRLGMTGAGTARPMTGAQLAEAVRIAYDPAAELTIEQAIQAHGTAGISWDDAGPVAHQEAWDAYRHDSAVSVTWGMSEAPRGHVLSGVLGELLAPHRDIMRKRVTLLYRPHKPGEAVRIVERDRRNARFKISGNNAAARDTAAVHAAEQTASEEARGAGVVRFAMLVTATVASEQDLPAAAAAIDSVAPTARVTLRRMYGAQASAFAACLPIGIVLPDHLAVPQTVREAM